MTEPLAFNKWARGVALASNGRYSEAIDALCARRSRSASGSATRRSARAPGTRSDGRTWSSATSSAAIEYNRKGLEIAHDVGDPEITINAQLNLADCAFAIGERERARPSELEELYAGLARHARVDEVALLAASLAQPRRGRARRR